MTKQLKLQNKVVGSLLVLVHHFEWSGSKQNRSARKLKKLLEKKNEEYQDDRNEVAKKYCVTGEDGNPVVQENGNYKVIDGQTPNLTKEMNQLADEEVTIEYGEYVNNIDEVYKVLDKTEKAFSGDQSDALVDFLEAYEDNQEEEK